ncbi:MAG TPA: DEAD/DEAH box helicase, partial [Actinomycetota bacterium]|nr:DEAD/DEAH box helicase [Actinomycetota bacterium]
MDIFAIRDSVVDEYKEFTTSFVEPRDPRISEFVKTQLDQGEQWPDPWISLNPFFASGGSISDAVNDGVLHPDCARIFRIKTAEQDVGSREITLHRHQREAIETARSGRSYVLTTGTGSGKSLAYIVPIVDRVLRQSDPHRKSVKAIVVYPMNALANSQLHELEKFLTYGFGRGRELVTFARYTGQESDDERRTILANPPDILLTNYVMLELLLTRPQERDKLIRAAHGLQFLVLDELHTYRGRQGADVAMLVRRVREACQSRELQCIGTSATMASGGSRQQQKALVAEVATRLFGAEVTPQRVIGETLERATQSGPDADTTALTQRVNQSPPKTFAALQSDPLACWVESTFGLTPDPEDGVLVRQRPVTVDQAAARLATRTGTTAEQARIAIRDTLSAGSRARHPVTDRPLFAFRIHQFLSKGDNVYVSLEAESTRHITNRYQVAVPHRPTDALYPLAFCRECGQEYLSVARKEESGQTVFRARHNRDGTDAANAGYLYVSEDLPWPFTTDEAIEAGRIPDSWTSTTDGVRLLDSRKDKVPIAVAVMPDGTQVAGKDTGLPASQAEDGVRAAFV